MKNVIEMTILNSLNKTVNNSFDINDELKEIIMLKNEEYSFQINLKSPVRYGWVNLKIFGLDKKDYHVSTVKYIYGKYIDVSNQEEKADDYYLDKDEGFYPDILLPLDKTYVHLYDKTITTLFVTIKLRSNKLPKDKLKISVVSGWKEHLCSKTLPIKIIDKNLVDNDLMVTHWFHHDCLSEYYHIKVFSKAYYKVFDAYLRNYVENGNTMLLVPLFTPCLDTEVGSERPTTQLVEVFKENGKWSFNFDKLDYYLSFIKERGIKYFEFSHLFTQWGAKFCPKVVYKENDKLVKGFGWKYESSSIEYREFLSALLPELDKYLKSKQYDKISVFHVSDEPNKDSIDTYVSNKAHMKKYLKDYTFMDALSDFDFANEVDLPVVADNHIQKFLDNKVPSMVYYCCVQGCDNVPNGFINMPALRSRIIGMMMYLNDSLGFLQWGYNFWFAPLSVCKINPYIYADGVGYFNPGDPFLVYPGMDYEPVDSTRNKIFNEAIQDYRLCKTVEQVIGKEEVKNIIRKYGVNNYNTYSHNNNDLLELKKELISRL